MDLKIEDIKQRKVVYLDGRLDVDSAPRIEEAIKTDIIDSGNYHIVLNLKDISYMSSSGLRMMISLMRTLKKFNGTLTLCELNSAVLKIFKIVELVDMFNIYKTQDEALAVEITDLKKQFD